MRAMQAAIVAAVFLCAAPQARADRDDDRCGEGERGHGEHGEKSCPCKLKAALAALASARAQLAAANAALAAANQTIADRNAALAAANQAIADDNAALAQCRQTVATSTLPASCAEALAKDPGAGDGVYTIQPAGSAPIQVRCLMSADGGGWTQVGNFVPIPGSTAGIAGWTSGNQVGSGFTDAGSAWKMSDALINQLKVTAYRVHGSATQCQQGPCSVDTTLFFSSACTYASGTRNPHCGEGFLDAGLSQPIGYGYSDSSACSWHWGLAASVCGVLGGMGSSHVGDHVFAGHIPDFIHAFDGRPGENPLLQFWVR